MSKHNPSVDMWYQNDDGEMFKVIAFDEDDETAEIQYFDGSIEEVDLDTWRTLELSDIDAPEDWSGPFDDLEPDDIDNASEIHHNVSNNDWKEDLDSL